MSPGGHRHALRRQRRRSSTRRRPAAAGIPPTCAALWCRSRQRPRPAVPTRSPAKAPAGHRPGSRPCAGTGRTARSAVARGTAASPARSAAAAGGPDRGEELAGRHRRWAAAPPRRAARAGTGRTAWSSAAERRAPSRQLGIVAVGQDSRRSADRVERNKGRHCPSRSSRAAANPVRRHSQCPWKTRTGARALPAAGNGGA